MFKCGELYSRSDIYKILNVPEDKQGGNWNTGYNNFNNIYYIFAGINTAGRTGHNYGNHWEDSLLYWRGKRNANINQKEVKRLLDKKSEIHIFTRIDSKNVHFIYQGMGTAERYEDTIPITIYWKIDNVIENYDTDEIVSKGTYIEGSVKQILVNAYERNEEARKECIKYYGCKCEVCNMDFTQTYGEIGSGFIHVHHLKQLSEINEEYKVDPIKDLRPVCPNCHAMIHRKKPPYSIEEIKKSIIE